MKRGLTEAKRPTAPACHYARCTRFACRVLPHEAGIYNLYQPRGRDANIAACIYTFIPPYVHGDAFACVVQPSYFESCCAQILLNIPVRFVNELADMMVGRT